MMVQSNVVKMAFNVAKSYTQTFRCTSEAQKSFYTNNSGQGI